MVKNSKEFSSTGGWGFQEWAYGDPSKPMVTNAIKQCFDCHAFRRDHDYVYASYLPQVAFARSRYNRFEDTIRLYRLQVPQAFVPD